MPKPNTERMLLSGKTCRGCRWMPKAAKRDSAAFDFRLSTSRYTCLDIHQLTFKGTLIVKGKAHSHIFGIESLLWTRRLVVR